MEVRFCQCWTDEPAIQHIASNKNLLISIDSRMPHNLRAAMFNAIFTSNLMSLPDPLYSCPTGNCTWDPE